jgi:hypothetical protein
MRRREFVALCGRRRCVRPREFITRLAVADEGHEVTGR